MILLKRNRNQVIFDLIFQKSFKNAEFILKYFVIDIV